MEVGGSSAKEVAGGAFLRGWRWKGETSVRAASLYLLIDLALGHAKGSSSFSVLAGASARPLDSSRYASDTLDHRPQQLVLQQIDRLYRVTGFLVLLAC